MTPSSERTQWKIDWQRFAEYIHPADYLRLLPEYSSRGVSDLTIFRRFLETFRKRSDGGRTEILELGSGTGRATEVLLKALPNCRVTAVDLSRRMREFFSEKYGGGDAVQCETADALGYLKSTKKRFDLVFALWSFSHAIHQCLAVHGLTKGRRLVESTLDRVLREVIRSGGEFYVIHFDSCSDEQKISLRQRRRLWTFLKPGVPSPSQVIIEEFFSRAAKAGKCRFRRQHWSGDLIPLGTVERAMEVYLKFHMEDIFGPVSPGDVIYEQLKEDLVQHKSREGLVRVKPAWFEYVVTKH